MSFQAKLSQFIKQETSGWQPFEVVLLVLFVLAQVVAYILSPDSVLAMISGIAGIICVVLVSKGKISNYFFGLIFAYTYFYVSWGQNFIGEMNSVLYVYLPSQFIGYFMWQNNLHKDGKLQGSVQAKALTTKGWIFMLLFLVFGTLIFVQILNWAGGSSTGLDGLTTIITFTAQLLMILRYREQWILWIALNIFSIFLWAETPAMYLMYAVYLLNSIYGYYNWTKLQNKNFQHC